MSHTDEVLYFEGEGRTYLAQCLERTFHYCKKHKIDKIVIFTGSGEGPIHALQHLLSQSDFSSLQVIAVTPPAGRAYLSDPTDPESQIVHAGINESVRALLSDSGIPVISAHLPFKGIQIGEERVSELSKIADALGILGGGLALCIQAILMACDAGEVRSKERIAAMTADTSIVAFASRTEQFLSPKTGLIVEHIIARPARFTISKPDHWYTNAAALKDTPALEAGETPAAAEQTSQSS